MHSSLKPYFLASSIVIGAVGLLLWYVKKKSFVKVGKISKLFFYPVKSMQAMEVTDGNCTPRGLEVNGLLDRSFMVINSTTLEFLYQKTLPRLALFSTRMEKNVLIIKAPSEEELRVEIKKSVSADDKTFDCKFFTDGAVGVDCGEEAAKFLQLHLDTSALRLVQKIFTSQTRKDNPTNFKKEYSFHVCSQASIDDLNSKLHNQEVSVLNFRPNILFDGCKAYEEDSWKYLKFNSGALLVHLKLTARCLVTTNDPSTAILSMKEPLVTLRRYRIPQDPDLPTTSPGSVPCFGTICGVLECGDVTAGDDVFAVVGPQPSMQLK